MTRGQQLKYRDDSTEILGLSFSSKMKVDYLDDDWCHFFGETY
ncbi:hypothetical protein [Schinkia azotoformans]|nr:hypothetical protein [Schinkia azotoformans]MEC1789725.1 hypothetical protein [Schinkia azotoformans]